MRRCPTCSGVISHAQVYGPLVYAHTSVEFDETGTVRSTGGIVPHCVIKNGQEIKAKGLTLTCPHCGMCDHIESFPVIRVCPFTGKDASKEIDVGIVSIYVDGESFQELDALVRQSVIMVGIEGEPANEFAKAVSSVFGM